MRNRNALIKSATVWIILIIGISFSSAGFANQELEFIPGDDSGFFYTIQQGDTLWDLSYKFYQSQWDWPGLWEMNDEIKNPHLIYPGKKIRIFFKERDQLQPKIVTVTKNRSEQAPEAIKPSFSYSQMDHIGFIRQKEYAALGRIIREKDGNLIITEDNIIYIRPSETGTLVPGKIYQVYSTETLNQKFDNQRFTGVKHLLKADIEVLEHRGDYVIARVIDSYRAVHNNDLIMEYYERDEILTVDENPAPIDARIICAEDHTQMINDYRIAFINIGGQTVKPGQIYSVMRKNETTDHSAWPVKKKDEIELENLKSGKLIILHTEDVASTVMILSSDYAIHPNDMVN